MSTFTPARSKYVQQNRDPIVWGGIAVVAISFLIRLLQLDSQSYWRDELFSVTESAGDLETFWEKADTQAHPPVYNVFLAGWIWLGRLFGASGTASWWTHAFSLLLVALGTWAAWRGLRRTRLTAAQYWPGLAAISASGMTMVYSLETRPYAPLLAGALGSIGYSLALLFSQDKSSWWWWTLWSFVASTASILGTALIGVEVLLLLLFWKWTGTDISWPPAIRSVLLAVSGQALWLLWGSTLDGFAAGTHWVVAPGLRSVLDLATSIFSSGDLVFEPGGFVWRSPWGLLGLSVLLGLALIMRYFAPNRWREANPKAASAPTLGTPQQPPEALGLAGAYCALVGAIVVIATFVGSQLVHVWILRTMLAVVPVTILAATFVLLWLARWAGARQLLAGIIVGASALMLLLTTWATSTEYKPDIRALGEYVERVQQVDPDVQVRFFSDDYLQLAAQPPSGTFSNLITSRKAVDLDADNIILTAGARGKGDPQAAAERKIASTGRSDCEWIPIPQMIVIHCGAAIVP